MKVILMQDVAKIGRKHEIVTVPDGYGMNKLLPKGLAKPATPENVKAINRHKAAQASANEASHSAFSELTTALADVTVTVTAEANEDGKLFQALKATDIAAALSTATGQTVTAEQVVVESPIKSVGEHTIVLASGADSVKQRITVTAA